MPTTRTRKGRKANKPAALPCRLAALRAAYQAVLDRVTDAPGPEAEAAAKAAHAALREEERSRVPKVGRLVRVLPDVAKIARIPAGLYRVTHADLPEYGVRVLDLIPPEGAAVPYLCADTFAVALRCCPRCETAGLSEELAWNAARGLCGVCCDREEIGD
jgi:hypothetical protein